MGLAKFDSKRVANNQIVAHGTERTNYFANVGKDVQTASSLETAIRLSGLDFEVKKMPIQFLQESTMNTGEPYFIPHLIKNQFATVRTDTMEDLGVVGKNYEILQNAEAFDFLDSMVGEAKFETAGSYGSGGAKSFITMSTEPMKILGDDFKPYILFTNSFDGTGSVRVMFTPIRVFCSNCLVRAIENGVNKVSIRHCASLKGRLEQAREVLLENSNYLNAIKAEAEKAAVTKFTEEQFKLLANQIFMTKEEDSDTLKARNAILIETLMKAYNQPDLQNFNNTAYKAIQAMSDFESHKPTFRQTGSMDYKNITTVMAGMPLTNMVAERVLVA